MRFYGVNLASYSHFGKGKQMMVKKLKKICLMLKVVLLTSQIIYYFSRIINSIEPIL